MPTTPRIDGDLLSPWWQLEAEQAADSAEARCIELDEQRAAAAARASAAETMVADLRSEAEASKETAQGHAAADEEQATATTEIAALREELAEMTERYEDASDRAASAHQIRWWSSSSGLRTRGPEYVLDIVFGA